MLTKIIRDSHTKLTPAVAHAPIWESGHVSTAIDGDFVEQSETVTPVRTAHLGRFGTQQSMVMRAAMVVGLFCLVSLTGSGLVAGLYIAKSAAGIDLFAGHSFLHDYLYFG